MKQDRSNVFLADASDRSQGIKRLFEEFDLRAEGVVALKANYNSDDPFPATTHIQTLKTLVELLKAETSAQIIMA
ncbi:MAG: hypothetical protein WB392_04700, partial [Methanotrichaceae archaeon]